MNSLLTRRHWLAVATLLATSALGKERKAAPYRYVLANGLGTKPVLPDGRYIPFDWTFSGIPAVDVSGDGVKLTWYKTIIDPKILPTGSSARLRITSATDVREDVLVAVKTSGSGKLVGVIDIRFAMYLQPFELPILAVDLPAVLGEGLTLTMTKGTKPFWFFTGNEAAPSAPTAYLPHLLITENQRISRTTPAITASKDRLLSLESVQTFGWMEGCVMDGLHELSGTSPNRTADRAKQVLQQHLDLFFANNSLVYANLNNRRAEGIINTVESILPFAMLAQTNPGHPLLQTAIQFCEKHANVDGVVADGTGTTGSLANRMIKTEECYTVSYPLAVLAKTLKRPELVHLAVQTALARVRLLTNATTIFQRGEEQGTPVFGNWSRGVVWYLLGLAKTLAHLPDSAESQSLRSALQTAVDLVLTHQQANGLWYCFMHQPESGLETSGTAGIAAALAYGQAKGLLPKSVLPAVVKARNGLQPYLTPDGYLTGTAQGNKGGDALQRGGYRVISPYTLGFLAHVERYRS